MKKILLPLILLALISNGCALIPKKVEFFQDKVHAYPELTTAQKETEKQAAQRAKEASQKTLLTAVADGSSTNLVSSATDAAVLSDAVSAAVGAPVKPSAEPAPYLAEQVYKSLAKHDRKVEAFKQDNNENAGKKIEGTGVLQIPYFVYLGLVVLVLFIGWHVVIVVLKGLQVAGVANPAVGAGATVGLGAMNVTSSLAGKAAAQLVKGGEGFKTWVSKEIQDTGLQQKILDAFRTSHMKAQDEEVQNVVKAVTK